MQIQKLQIFTSRLTEQTIFYTEVLELEIVEQTATAVSFQIGTSILTLRYSATAVPYHYAINVPANQENEALAWLQERLEVIAYENNTIQYFDFWDAHAIYFYDADRNILELIARKTLANESHEPFSKGSLLEICEIGLPTTDVKREYELLHELAKLPIYSGSLERFCSIGDEHGLFIVINKDLKKKWFPTTDTPLSADFNIRLMEQGVVYELVYEKEILKTK